MAATRPARAREANLVKGLAYTMVLLVFTVVMVLAVLPPVLGGFTRRPEGAAYRFLNGVSTEEDHDIETYGNPALATGLTRFEREHDDDDWFDRVEVGKAVVVGIGGQGARVARVPVLLALTGVLAAIGLVMVLSSSHVDGLKDTGSSWYFFQRQLLWVAVGTVALVLASRLDYRAWRVLSRPLLFVTLALLVIVLVPGVGISVNGSTRWLGGSSWRIQPSELAKLAVVLALATVFDRRFEEVRDFSRSTRPVLVLLGVVLGLVMLQPDMGTTLILGTIGMGLLFVAGTPLPVMGTLTVAGSFLALVAGLLAPYRRERLLSFMDPWADAGNTGYQAIQARVGLSSGGLFGVGLGASRSKWGYLPNAHTDFIFAIIGEEAGLIGGLLVVALFVAFAVLGIRTALRAPDRFGCFLAAGITIWVVGQAFLNIGAVIGILPITGVPLPFISFGGSSLVVLMLAVGILLNVARQSRPVRAS